MSVVGSGRPKHGTVTKYKIIQLDDDPPPSRAPSRYYEREPDRDRLPPREWKWERESAPPGELERYTRSTEYYAPQPIIIRSDPVIIREPAEQQMVDRDRDRDRNRDREERRPSPRREDQRQLARRPQTPEEDYYYERRTRELDRPGRDDYEYDERDYRREVRPKDSASQYQGQGDDYSDDEYYYRKDTTRGSSPNHKRHLAEGAVVGLGAAALLQHHRKSEGEKPGGYGQLIGGAALGTVGAEVVTRVRDHYTRSSSEDSEERGGRSRSRGVNNLAKLGAVAALGALATYAVTRNNKGKNGGDDRRIRSRRRRGSVSRNRSRSESRSSAQDAKRKNNIIAGAGLASAAAAGIWERTRSKSRPGRSKSRVRQGVPIVAAGLGGAALAGLYEKQKTKSKPQPKARSASRRRTRARGSRSHSGSRSRSKSRGRDADFGPYADGYLDANRDRNLIEYGEDPVVAERATARRHRRRSPSSSTSPPPRRRLHEERSRSRGRWDSSREGGAAHEASKRREKNRAEKDRHGQDPPQQEQIEHSNDPYNFGPYAQAPPPAPASAVPVAAYPPTGNYQSEPYASRQYGPDQYHPHGNYFPPPPEPTTQGQPQSTYDNPYASPYEQSTYPNPSSNINQYQQYPNDDRHRQDNVSTASSFRAPERDVVVPLMNVEPPMLGTPNLPETDTQNAESRPAIRRAKSVQFDLGRNERRAVDGPTRYTEESGDANQHDRYGHQDEGRKKRRNSTEEDRLSTRREHHEQRPKQRNASPESASSDATIELPARFDSRGRKVPERGDDTVADKLEDIMNGKGLTGGLLQMMEGEIGVGKGRR